MPSHSQLQIKMINKEYSSTKPISILTVQIKTKKIYDLIKKIKDEENYNVNFSDVIINSICKNLADFPELNSNYLDGKIIPYSSVNMGYFINLGKGSKIVNIKNADKYSLIGLSKKIKETALKYLHGELNDSEKENGTFSITNLFSFKVYSVIPPLYENQSAMISISSEFDSIENKNGAIFPVKKINLTLSYDSRVANCQRVLQFMNAIKKELESGKIKEKKNFKLLLIDANDRWISRDKKIGEQAVLPIGLMYLSSYLKKFLRCPIEINLINTLVDTENLDELKEKVSEFNPDMVGIRLLSVNLDYFNKILPLFPDGSKIVVGGPHVNLNPLEILNKKEVDFIVMNEGEETLLELIKSIMTKENFYEIDGLGYKKNGRLRINKPRKFIEDLDSIPFPDYSLINLDKYSRFLSYGYTLRRQGIILSSRGCPFNCSYCFNFTGRKFRKRSAQNVFEEIKELYEKYDIRDFFIVDDNFNIDRQRCIDFFNMIINSELKINLYFTSGLRGDLMDKEFIDLMVDAGTIWVTFGVETVNDRVQKIANRIMDVGRLKNSIKYCCEKGIMVGAFFMIGFPNETKSEAMETLHFIENLKGITMPYLFGVKFYPGTNLYRIARDMGILNKEQKENIYKPYHEISTHKTDMLSENDFKELFIYFMKEIFLDKKRLEKAIKTQRKFLSDEEIKMVYSTFMNRNIESPEKEFNINP